MSTRNQQIRELYAAGATMAALGERFGISAPRVMQILHNGGKVVRAKANGRTAYTAMQLTEAVKETVKKVAEADDMSLSAWLAKLVDEELARRGVKVVKAGTGEEDVPLPLEG